jgi:hypothetical protein
MIMVDDSLIGGGEALAISVRQPWAELIISGEKSIEVREWSAAVRGPLWIHASRTVDEHAMDLFGKSKLFAGGLVGRVDLVDVLPLNPDRWEKWRSRHRVPGPMPSRAVAFVLENPHRLKAPIGMPGRLKIFRVHDGIAQGLHENLLE